MALVIEQSVPYSGSDLGLDDPSRWRALFPLIRPSTTTFQPPSSPGSFIVVDNLVASADTVRVVAVGKPESFSTRFLDTKNIAALVAEEEKGAVSLRDFKEALGSNGIGTKCGLVVIRCGTERKIDVTDDDVLLVEMDGELEFNHLLDLLTVAKPDIRASWSENCELVKNFVKNATRVESTFHTEKIDGKASVLHETGHHAFASAKEALTRDLKHVLRSRTAHGHAVYSIHYADVNGLSQLENYILAYEISDYLDEQNIVYHIASSALSSKTTGARGWAVSVCPLPSNCLSPLPKPPNTLSQASAKITSQRGRKSDQSWKIQFSDAEVRQCIERGCNAVVQAEPAITEYDTIVGDGDCGMTLRDGARKVMQFVKDKDLTELPDVLAAMVDDLEVEMGGTSGALYCIFLSAFSQGLRSADTVPMALNVALQQLMRYTRARRGDRTCMDCLIPFVETLSKGGHFERAIEEARKGVEETKMLEAKLGRSSYLDEKAIRNVPDPGAYGLLVLLEGLSGGG